MTPTHYMNILRFLNIKNSIISLILLLFGCVMNTSPFIERMLFEDNNSGLITIYYPVPDNFILEVHSASIFIDDRPFFFLNSGEHIQFYLPVGSHKFEVSAFSSHFDYKETIEIYVAEEQSYYLKTFPVFEGMTFIPYWFIPLPAVDIRFKIFEVDKDRALTDISGQPVSLRKRSLID